MAASSLHNVEQLLLKKGEAQDMLSGQIASVTLQDAVYHSSMRDEWIDKNQLNAERNMFFHKQVLAAVANTCDYAATVLELGAGVGFDAHLFMSMNRKFRCYIVSEISADLLVYTMKTYPEMKDLPVVFCALDAGRMMIADRQIDAVFMIATLHHFPELPKALLEIDRVTKDDATIVFGIEPNRLWLRVMAGFRPLVRRLFQKGSHSAADDEAEGFVRSDFVAIGESMGWSLRQLVPVWCFAGFLHYGLEFLFKVFHMRRRLVMPFWLERVVLLIDRVFFLLPFAGMLAWHYTAVYKKQKKTCV